MSSPSYDLFFLVNEKGRNVLISSTSQERRNKLKYSEPSQEIRISGLADKSICQILNGTCVCVHVCVCAQLLSRVRLFGSPWTVARQAPLFMEFSRQEYWNSLPFTTPRDRPDPGVEPSSLVSPALAGGFFTTRATWEGLMGHTYAKNILAIYLKFKFIWVSCIFIHWLWPTLSARTSLAPSKAGASRASLKNLTGKNCSHWGTINNHQKMEPTHELSMHAWINGIWSIHTMKYYSAVKKNAVLIHAIRWKHHAAWKHSFTRGQIPLIPFTQNIHSQQIYGDLESRLEVFQGHASTVREPWTFRCSSWI